jgi:hypothetical protein
LMVLSPLFAELAMEAGWESCCTAGAECSADGVCWAGSANDIALNNMKTARVGKSFFIIWSQLP